MKAKYLLATGLIGAMLVSTAIGATTAVTSKQPPVTLYAKPNAQSAVIAHYNQNTPLTAFYREGQWIKVGNSHNGTVGWVNISALKQHARQQQEKTPTIITHVQKTPYGNLQTTERSGTVNGVQYHIVTSHLDTKDQTSVQHQRWEHHLATQQQAMVQQMQAQERAIDQQIENNMKSMNQLFNQLNQ